MEKEIILQLLKLLLADSKDSTMVVTEHEHAIVVADRGHVWVGDVEECGEKFIIRNARIIRVWGTTRGLNELAVNGPRENTKLDQIAPIVKVLAKAVIAVIPTPKNLWPAS